MKNKPELNRIDKMKVELVTLFQYSIEMLLRVLSATLTPAIAFEKHLTLLTTISGMVLRSFPIL